MGFGLGIAIAASANSTRTTTGYTKAPRNNTTLVVIGGGVSLVGFLLTITANNHIGKAGRILRDNGLVLDIPIKRKK